MSWSSVRLSRVDLHADWQGGWVPTPANGLDDSPRRFIKPARVKWHAFTDGTTFTGFVFGIRWLAKQGRQERPDRALDILRERYARGEINKEEFEARRRDLDGRGA